MLGSLLGAAIITGSAIVGDTINGSIRAVARPPAGVAERRRDVFASTQFMDVEQESVFPALVLLMILLSILGIVAQAAFA